MNRLWRSAVAAALGGLLFGFDTAVVSGVTRAWSEVYRLTPGMLGATVSIALWGTLVGAATAGFAGDQWGRKRSLQALGFFYVVSALGSAMAWAWLPLVLFRFVGGLAIGGSSVLGPMYIAEISPPHLRGRMVGMFQFNIVLGILVAYLSNYAVGQAGLGEAEWRWKLGIAAAPAILFCVMMFGIPQSPRWLAGRGRIQEAEAILQSIGDADPRAAIREIQAGFAQEREAKSHRLFTASHAFPVFLAVSIGFFNQISGINAILYYLNDIFERGGFNKVSSDLQAVLIGLTNLLFTIAALSVIDRVGRKKLLLAGAVGTGVCLAGVAYLFHSRTYQGALVWLLVGFIASFAFSQGAVIWVYLSEIFPTSLRAKGQSLGSFTHWAMNAMISGVFPAVAALYPAAPFAFFAGMMAVQFVVVLLWYPETKGVSLEALQKELQAR